MIFNQVLRFSRLFLFVWSLSLAPALAQDEGVLLHAETWDIPRHGEVLLKIPALSSVITKWLLDPQQKIQLRYPGGEEGELWVEELKDWFIALGIPSRQIQATPGSNAQDIINILLIKA